MVGVHIIVTAVVVRTSEACKGWSVMAHATNGSNSHPLAATRRHKNGPAGAMYRSSYHVNRTREGERYSLFVCVRATINDSWFAHTRLTCELVGLN